ncbi:MAG: TadE/TadG family type IV pilus assembly protein [Lachnospiraceae bacterium]
MKQEGSITVESALIIPVFCFVMLTIHSIFWLMEIQLHVQEGMRNVCQQGCICGSTNYIVDFVKYRYWFKKSVDEDWLDSSWIDGGKDGVWLLGNVTSNDCLQLRVYYKVKIPSVPITISCMQKYEQRINNGKEGSEEEKHYVYVTEQGSVYHTYLDCSYLQLDVSGVEYKEAEKSYAPCGICGGQTHGQVVYVTREGTAWHSTLNCYTLTRKIHCVELEEVEGLAECSRCQNR